MAISQGIVCSLEGSDAVTAEIPAMLRRTAQTCLPNGKHERDSERNTNLMSAESRGINEHRDPRINECCDHRRSPYRGRQWRSGAVPYQKSLVDQSLMQLDRGLSLRKPWALYNRLSRNWETPQPVKRQLWDK